MEKTLTGITPPVADTTRAQRYMQLMLLVIAAGAIYPLLYLRQVYQTPMLEFFHIDNSQLGYLYSILGTVFLLSYLPSGWLADRIAPRFLICFSLIATGALGLVYSTAPSFPILLAVFCCWGLTTGLTFWASILKRVKTIAAHDEQGRFFGLLDGGRGLIEALLATVALVIFATATRKARPPDQHGLPIRRLSVFGGLYRAGIVDGAGERTARDSNKSNSKPPITSPRSTRYGATSSR